MVPGARTAVRLFSSPGSRLCLEKNALAIQIPSNWMVSPMPNNLHELRPKAGDTEKITINLGFVDLGHIDLLVQEGFSSNRTDFIRTAIRNQTGRHDDVVRKAVTRK